MQESVPDQVELRLGYGAMLLGKVGDGSGVCSLEHVLRQIAALCFLCMAALTCIQVCPPGADWTTMLPEQRHLAVSSLTSALCR